ncbi:hypothetical protein GE107_21500 [Cohnella sp. CFH 77786]|uniref:hypothetical protein n=1 Tax=Cohnella sp. CFH 77786 TaxID=2662265 RepID=UPI001C60DED1|nr:hypothetical protein [Cohnella sp. CFH 77786]MBW5448626.1 hypothetical protein [Cohnella sp. CFH 77786]
MFIVEARNKSSLWISGIFKEVETLNGYLNQIPDNLKVIQTIIEVNIEYPFYIIEKNGFSYVNKVELFRIMDNLVFDVEDDDNVLFNFYFISSDYMPTEPGTDYMGILPHEHVTGYSMLRFNQYGREDYMKRNGFL